MFSLVLIAFNSENILSKCEGQNIFPRTKKSSHKLLDFNLKFSPKGSHLRDSTAQKLVGKWHWIPVHWSEVLFAYIFYAFFYVVRKIISACILLYALSELESNDF